MIDSLPIQNTSSRSLACMWDVVPVSLHSISLLDSDLDQLDQWVRLTRATLSKEELLLAGSAADALLFVHSPKAGMTPRDAMDQDIFAWIEHFCSLDPKYIALQRVTQIHSLHRRLLPQEATPTAAQILSSRDQYAKITKAIHSQLGQEMDDDCIAIEYGQLSNSRKWQEELATLVRKIWHDSLRDELRMQYTKVEQSINAMKAQGVDTLPLDQAMNMVSGRDTFPDHWMERLSLFEQIMWMPSPFTGPYVNMVMGSGSTSIVLSRPRHPHVQQQDNQLDTDDLVIRLTALGDPTRLAILAMAQVKEVITTAMVMDALDLTQSSASRHLVQLSATGLLHVDAREKTKKFRVHKKNLVMVAEAIQRFST